MSNNNGTTVGTINLLLQIKANIEQQVSDMAGRATQRAKENFDKVGQRAGQSFEKGFNASINKKSAAIKSMEKQLTSLQEKLDSISSAKMKDYEDFFPDRDSLHEAVGGMLDKDKSYQKILTQSEKLDERIRLSKEKLAYDIQAFEERKTLMAEKAAERQAQARERAAERARKAEERARLAAEKNREKQLKKATKGFRTLGKNILRSFKSVFMMTAVYAAFKTLRSLLSSATRDSKKFTDSLNTVKANLLGAFTPIISAVMPMLESLMATLARITTYITSFIAGIFGKTYRQVMAKTKKLQSTANGSEKKGSLAGFDEINQLSTDNGSGTGGIDFGSISEEGDTAATKLGEKFAAAFDKIKTFLSPLSQAMTGMFENALWAFSSFINAVAPGIGKMLEIMSPALIGLRDIFVAVFDFIGEKWGLLAIYLSERSEAISQVFSNLGNAINTLWEEWINPVLNWIGEKFGFIFTGIEKLLGGFTDFLLGIFSGNTELALKGIESMFDGFAIVVTGILLAITERIKAVVDYLGTTIKGGFKIALGSIVALFAKAYNSVVSAVEAIANAMIGVVNGIISKIKSSNIGNWVSEALNINELSPVTLTRMPIPQFASGGAISGPTLGLMGEYAGAYSNPEIVAPQSLMLETFMQAVTPLVESIRQLIENTNSGQEIHIHLDGSLSAFARVFRPYLDDEAKRKGVKLIIES